jgi:histone-lysine N-methyltransferase SETMAR
MWKNLSASASLCVEKNLILHHNNAPAHKDLTVKQFLVQKSVTEMDYPPYSPDLAPNDFWIFPQIKSAVKG